MKDYRLFDLMDFTMDEDFIRWVYNKQPADDSFWKNWLIQNPHKHLIVAEARRILECVTVAERELSDTEIDSEISRLLNTINVTIEKPKPMQKTIHHVWWIAAAAILAVLAGCWWLLQPGSVAPKILTYTEAVSRRSLIEYSNTSANPLSITLEDGTRVRLFANSRISYGKKLDSTGTRDVYLSGEAFFEVTKNPSHPFRVFANEIVTKVLGTSFTVRSFENDSTIRVTVKTGKVSVYAQAGMSIREVAQPGKLSGIILTPNQQLVYEKAGQKFQRVLLENPEMIVLPDMAVLKRDYEDEPLEKVFSQLAKEYGINIVYDADVLKDCTVTAELSTESFYHKLDLISKAVGAKYEVIDGQVVIQSSGCH